MTEHNLDWLTPEQRARYEEAAPESREKIYFGYWLEARFNEWALRNKPTSGRGVAASKADFARWTGVHKQMVSQFMLGSDKPTQHMADLLAAKLGIEVYRLLGYPPRLPNDKLTIKAMEEFMRLSTDGKRHMLEALRDKAAEEEREARVRLTARRGETA